MSLDVYLMALRRVSVFDANITHNLNTMADAAGIYQHVWRPDELGIKTAAELIEPLRAGIERMEADPTHFKTFDPPNLWGSYDVFLPWLKRYLAACKENPDAEIEVSR